MNDFKPFVFFLLLSGLLACNTNQEQQAAGDNQSDAAAQPTESAAPDWAKNANIYEVNIRQYTPEGTLSAFAENLPRLKEMGVDILWFMPIFPISETKKKGKLGSYYAVSDFTKINPEFGTMADFDSMVQQIHELDMKIILDWVPNHTGWDHVWLTENPDYYTQDSLGNVVDPINPETGESWGWTDVADLNYDNPEMRREMIEKLKFWITEKNVDGFRMDVAHGVPADFWADATEELRAVKPDIFLLAEGEVAEQRNEGWFAMDYGWSFHHTLNEVAQDSQDASDIWEWYEKDTAQYDRGYHMHFIDNHDENSWAGTVEERMGDAADAMAVIAFTFDGMPLIYSGQESSLDKRLNFFERDPIEWKDYPKADFYATLLDLKHDNKALWNGRAGGPPVKVETNEPEEVLAYSREKDGDKVLVVVNLEDENQSVTLNCPACAGNYTDVFTKASTTVTGDMTLELGPWEYVVLSTK